MFFLFYLAFGATVFSAIEAPEETKLKKDLIEKKNQFLEKHSASLSGKQTVKKRFPEIRLRLRRKQFSNFQKLKW